MKAKSNSSSRMLAANVLRLRQLKQLTQDDLARQLGVTASRISQVERYEFSPTLSFVDRLAEALDIQPSALLMEFPDSMAELEKIGR